MTAYVDEWNTTRLTECSQHTISELAPHVPTPFRCNVYGEYCSTCFDTNAHYVELTHYRLKRSVLPGRLQCLGCGPRVLANNGKHMAQISEVCVQECPLEDARASG